MLTELYEYSQKLKEQNQELLIEPGWSKKNVKAYICLSEDGEFLDEIEPYQTKDNKEKKCVPDIGSEAFSPDKCNFPVEKFGIIFCLPEKTGEIKPTTEKKHSFFRDKIKEISDSVEEAKACWKIFEDRKKFEQIKNELEKNKIKSSDIIGFKIDGKYLEDLEDFKIWYKTYKADKSLSKEQKSDESMICFITGESVYPKDTKNTTPKIIGLQSVGGHSSGDSLISFDKAAFTSYELEQTKNACVSEEAMSAIKVAIEELINNSKLDIPGCKILYWYKRPIPKENDPMNTLSNNEEDIDADITKIDETTQKLKNGENILTPNNTYYILALAGASGRIVVKSWMYGKFEELCTNISKWYDDLKLLDYSTPKKLFAYYFRILVQKSSSNDQFDRIHKELSKISLDVFNAIIKNKPRSDIVANRAFEYIISKIYDKKDDTNTNYKDNENKQNRLKTIDSIACSLLKAWLIRKQENYPKEENEMAPDLDENNENIAYLLGRLFAVYAKLQNEAVPEYNRGLAERFFHSASTNPAFIFGKIAELAEYQFPKLKEEKKRIYYKKMLTEIYEKLGNRKIPEICTLKEKSEFAVGYYQQYANMYKKNDKEGEKENVD